MPEYDGDDLGDPSPVALYTTLSAASIATG
jgi:hypothetical protein